ncbi:uncharacterized protein ARMOST_17482 [Armillaria ostoyae]|uniref:Uncharacterized protein n=1 Tax=Armillaria ostoyae TaxID=47428 RepID=A0A284RZ90_ARMOS|nr:uncharacterized protein ARMOST_17482 [Armillaria ostoyae]
MPSECEKLRLQISTSHTKTVKKDSVTANTIDTVPHLPTSRSRSTTRPADEAVSYAGHVHRTRPVAANTATEEQPLRKVPTELRPLSLVESGRGWSVGAGTGANSLSDFVKVYLKAASSESVNAITGFGTVRDGYHYDTYCRIAPYPFIPRYGLYISTT